jgi:hypothetical protein
MSTAVAAPVFHRPTVRATALLLLAAWVVPFVVHLIPWSGERPIGAYLLPMFWTAFIATYFYGARIGALVGVFVPVLNVILTGLPDVVRLGSTVTELVTFAAVAALLVGRFPRLWVVAPLAYVVAKIFSAAVVALLRSDAAGWAPAALAASLTRALAGLAVLLVINVVLMRLRPKSPAGHDAAGV